MKPMTVPENTTISKLMCCPTGIAMNMSHLKCSDELGIALRYKKHTHSVAMLDEKQDMGGFISDHFPCKQSFLRFGIIKWPRHHVTTNE